MFRKVDWINIAEIVSKESISKSLSILSSVKNDLNSEQINDFIVSIIPKMNNEDKNYILCSDSFFSFIKELSGNTIFNYKNNENNSLLKSIFITLKNEADDFFINRNKNKVEKIDKLLAMILDSSSVIHISENLRINIIKKSRETININAPLLLIQLGMKNSLLKLMDKGFSVFDEDENLRNISCVDVLNLYLTYGGSLYKSVYNENEFYPLWVLLMYKPSKFNILLQNKKDFKNYITENIDKKILKEEEIKRYWKKWESDTDPTEYFDSIDNWQDLKTIDNKNVLLLLIEKSCNKINSLYRKKEFINHLKESDSNGNNVWGYLLGYNETKNTSLSPNFIPYIKQKDIYPTINNMGQGLIRQSKAKLNISERSNIEKIILKSFDNTIWLGNDEEQQDFANELAELCLSMDKLRNNQYQYIISYISDFLDITQINKELLYSIYLFYAISDKYNEKFEEKMSFLTISCPSKFIDKQDEYMRKITNESKNISDKVIYKLKEAKIYTKMMVKTIDKHGKMLPTKNINTKSNRL